VQPVAADSLKGKYANRGFVSMGGPAMRAEELERQAEHPNSGADFRRVH